MGSAASVGGALVRGGFSIGRIPQLLGWGVPWPEGMSRLWVRMLCLGKVPC